MQINTKNMLFRRLANMITEGQYAYFAHIRLFRERIDHWVDTLFCI